MRHHIIASLLCLTRMLPAQADWIEAGVVHSEPFAIEGRNGDLAGIAVDIANEIGKRTGHVFAVTAYPAVRMQERITTKTEQVVLFESPQWFDSLPQNYVFSAPYLHIQAYIYYPTGKALNVQKPMDLARHTVGVRHGYYYPAFNDLFKNNVVMHQYSLNSDSLLRKLLAWRVDAVFLDDIEFGYTIKNSKTMKTSDFTRGMLLRDTPVGFMIRKDRLDLLKQVNQAIAQLQADGTITRLVNHYIR